MQFQIPVHVSGAASVVSKNDGACVALRVAFNLNLGIAAVVAEHDLGQSPNESFRTRIWSCVVIMSRFSVFRRNMY